jgi:hypothetical protein
MPGVQSSGHGTAAALKETVDSLMKVVRWILIGFVAIVALWAVSMPLVIGALDQDIAARARARPPLPISLAIGGEGCDTTPTPTRFTTADKIRLISARPPGGEDVMVELFELPHDTAHLSPAGFPAHRQYDRTAACVSEDLPPLPAGEFEAWVHVGESRAWIDFRVVAP